MPHEIRLPALTIEEMAEVDRLMIEAYEITLLQMMENAGRNLAEQASRMLAGDLTRRHVIVLCGAGNNGGGGMVAARHLHNRGAHVQAVLAARSGRLKEVPAHQWRILNAMHLTAHSSTISETPDLVIDALIGYGLQGNPEGEAARWIEWANAVGCPVLSLDIPSGLNATHGTPGEPCIRAEATLTLALPKIGLLSHEAAPFIGALYLADISVPPALYARLGLDVRPLFARDTILKLDGQDIIAD